MTGKAAGDRTIQDDRAELAADPHDGSSLTTGEGAPLAQDDVPEEGEPVITQALLGGAPVAIIDDNAVPPSGGGMTAPKDRPIND